MVKAKKHYLEKKMGEIEHRYAKEVTDKYSELKNIYRGRGKEGKKESKLHKAKDRYEAAETYFQDLDNKSLIPEQREYLHELARTFLEYDLKLDKKRKEPLYKEAVRKKRIDHLGKTLEYMAEEETSTPVQPLNNALNAYAQQPVITAPASTPTVTPALNVQPNTTGPGLVARVYNATGRTIKKYWRYGATFVAGAAVGSLLTYYCMTKPVIKPTVKEPPKQEYVMPKQETPEPIIKPQEPKSPIVREQEPKKPIIKKQEHPVVKEPKKETPVIKEEPKQAIEEQKPVVPKVEEIILTEKDWTKKFKKGEIDLNKYDVFFSGMWHDPGAIVAYEKGTDKIKFDTAMSGQLMWDKVETKKELGDLIWMMYKNNAFGQGRIALRAEHLNNKSSETVGIIFTDAINRTIIKQKDGKVMVYSIQRQMLDGGNGSDSTNGGPTGGSGNGGSM